MVKLFRPYKLLAEVKVVYSCLLQKVVRQNDTVVMSRFMQLEKVGCGLLREAFWGEGECYISFKRRGQIREYRSWKIQVNIGTLKVNKNVPLLFKLT